MSTLRFTENAAPGTPAAGKVAMYAKTDGKVYTKDDNGIEYVISQDYFGISITIGDGVYQINSGIKHQVVIPYDCILTEVYLVSSVSGSMVIDIWKAPFADYPPTNADSITSATPPTLVTETTYSDTTLSSWTTTIDAGDYLFFNVDSCTTCNLVNISLIGRKLA
jgi:hypothetical protein